MNLFGLELEENKSRLIEFVRYAQKHCQKRGEKPDTFTFLGFTHYCFKSLNGKFRVKRKTSKKKFARKCKEVNRWIAEMRTMPIKMIITKVNRMLVGYDHYYEITDNFKSLNNFHYRVWRMLFYWLNCRSQKHSYNWNTFADLLKKYPLVQPKIYVSIYSRLWLNHQLCKEPDAEKLKIPEAFAASVRPVSNAVPLN